MCIRDSCTPAWATHEAQLVVSIRVIVLKMRFLMSCEFGLQMPIHAPLFFGGKMGKTETVCSFITLAMCVLWIKPRRNRSCGLVSGREQNKRESDILLICWDAPTAWGDRFTFWLAGSYRRRIHPCQTLWQSVQGFRSSYTHNFAILHRNSSSLLQQCRRTTVLHCDSILLLILQLCSLQRILLAKMCKCSFN